MAQAPFFYMPRDTLFSWRLMARYIAVGAVPLLLAFVVAEYVLGEATFGAMILVLAFLLPFAALAWLGYQNFRKR
jgi:hypothetical protein